MMPRPLLISSQSDYLIRVFDTNSHIKWQTLKIQISWLLQKPTDLDLHCLLGQGMSCSAKEGLISEIFRHICLLTIHTLKFVLVHSTSLTVHKSKTAGCVANSGNPVMHRVMINVFSSIVPAQIRGKNAVCTISLNAHISRLVHGQNRFLQVQSTLVISTSLISNNRLSRIVNLVPV